MPTIKLNTAGGLFAHGGRLYLDQKAGAAALNDLRAMGYEHASGAIDAADRIELTLAFGDDAAATATGVPAGGYSTGACGSGGVAGLASTFTRTAEPARSASAGWDKVAAQINGRAPDTAILPPRPSGG